MAFYDRVRVAIPTKGTGAVVLGNAALGYKSLSQAGVPVGEAVSYVIEDLVGAFEAGTGKILPNGSFERSQIMSSSNANQPISLTGLASLFLSPLSIDLARVNQSAGAADAGKGVQLASDGTIHPSMMTRNGAIDFPGRVRFGATPGSIDYELASGGQPALVPIFAQHSDVSGRIIHTSFVKFNSGPKALTMTAGTNRGTGIPGAGFGSKTLAGDRIFSLLLYGGKDSDGTTTAFAHAGGIFYTAETNNDGGNEIAAMLHLRPGVDSTTRVLTGAGNGLQINYRMQSAFPGPNRLQFAAGEDFGAAHYIGPGSLTSPQMKVDAGPLTTVPTACALESDPDGNLHRTPNDGRRRRMIATESFTLSPPVPPAGQGTIVVEQGVGWVKVTRTYEADAAALAIRLNIPAGAVASPPIACFSAGNEATARIVGSAYLDTRTDRIVIATPASGGPAILANTPYVFFIMYQTR